MAQDYGTGSGLSVQLEGPFAGGGGAAAKMAAVYLPADGWKNAESPYFQQVQVDGISVSSMVLIQPDRAQLDSLCRAGTAIHIDNEEGVTVAYAVGTKPAADLRFQVTLLEVTAL